MTFSRFRKMVAPTSLLLESYIPTSVVGVPPGCI